MPPGDAPPGSDGLPPENLHRSAYEEAARRATEDHPLPGEDLESHYPEDADLWVNVYTQLLNFKDALIRTADEQSVALAPEALDEVRSTDALVLSAELERFRRRLAYWMARREELRSQQADG